MLSRLEPVTKDYMIHLHKMSRECKSIDTESRLMIAQGQEKQEVEGEVAKSYNTISFEVMKYLKIDYGNTCTTCL